MNGVNYSRKDNNHKLYVLHITFANIKNTTAYIIIQISIISR